MAKKNWWLNLLKHLFTCESKSKQKSQKGKTKGWRWLLGGAVLKQLPNAPPPKSLSEAREEQRMHAIHVAKAATAAAEAAVAAAQAAAEVVRLTGVSRPSLRFQDREFQNLAAIKIQTAFRGYLARKVLRALKGVVRIQAIARGRAVRRRISTSLKHLPLMNHSQLVHPIKPPKSFDVVETNPTPKFECKSHMQWTEPLCSKEEIESIYSKRQEVVIRRERMKQYSFSHRERQHPHMLEETVPLRNSERQTWLRRQWMEENVYNKSNSENPNARSNDSCAKLRIDSRNSAKMGELGQEANSPLSHPRRSFCHQRLKFGGDDYQLSSSPIFPTYMAATESTKAKMRSMSTPRQRLGYLDTCFEDGSWSLYNREPVSRSTIEKSNFAKSLSMEFFGHA